MALMSCRSCSTRFAVGLLRCPQCNAVSELYAVPDYVADAEEENMPKITIAGASNAAEQDEAEPVPTPTVEAPAPSTSPAEPAGEESAEPEAEPVAEEPATPQAEAALAAKPRKRAAAPKASSE